MSLYVIAMGSVATEPWLATRNASVFSGCDEGPINSYKVPSAVRQPNSRAVASKTSRAVKATIMQDVRHVMVKLSNALKAAWPHRIASR